MHDNQPQWKGKNTVSGANFDKLINFCNNLVCLSFNSQESWIGDFIGCIFVVFLQGEMSRNTIFYSFSTYYKKNKKTSKLIQLLKIHTNIKKMIPSKKRKLKRWSLNEAYKSLLKNNYILKVVNFFIHRTNHFIFFKILLYYEPEELMIRITFD